MSEEAIEPKFSELMNATAHGLDDVFNGRKTGKERSVGFALLVFPFGEAEGRCNYISNADKADMLAFFKFQVARLEGRLSEEKSQGGH